MDMPLERCWGRSAGTQACRCLDNTGKMSGRPKLAGVGGGSGRRVSLGVVVVAAVRSRLHEHPSVHPASGTAKRRAPGNLQHPSCAHAAGGLHATKRRAVCTQPLCTPCQAARAAQHCLREAPRLCKGRAPYLLTRSQTSIVGHPGAPEQASGGKLGAREFGSSLRARCRGLPGACTRLQDRGREQRGRGTAWGSSVGPRQRPRSPPGPLQAPLQPPPRREQPPPGREQPLRAAGAAPWRPPGQAATRRRPP